MVGGVSLSRMLIGTNWILGWSHTTAAADKVILKCNASRDDISSLLQVYLNAGVDTIMAPFTGGNIPQDHIIFDAMKDAEDKSERKLILVDTPIINIADTAEARLEAEAVIAQSKKIGCTFCLPHHSSVERLVNKGNRTIDRLPDYLSMIREHDMIPGLSAHMPELIVYPDANEYDVETYVQIFNSAGFLMQLEVEGIHRIIWAAKKPVMTIKSMAAGRLTPFVGLTFAWNCLRDQDMVTVGAMTPSEAVEDIEISHAALERRPPFVESRNSPNRTEIMKNTYMP